MRIFAGGWGAEQTRDPGDCRGAGRYMSNISYRAKLVRVEGGGLGQPRASGYSDERKRVRTEVGSFFVRLIGGIIAVALLWILVSRFVVPALI